MNQKTLASITLALLLPLPALGAVQITEVMYDLSGADTGREWVEITNTGSSAVDVSGYKFFEANTNHALSAVSGTGVLQPGSSAIVADDSAKFLLDWPAYSGTLFDSSFSLSNTGETVAIKDGSLTVLDTVAYDSGAGAAGDGNSLQRSGSAFVAATPNPGSYNSGGSSSSSGNSSSSDSAATSSSSVQNIQVQAGAGPPSITVYIKADATVMVGGGSFFEAEAYGVQGLPLPGARFIWNFGDGVTAEGVRVFHAYSYPGKYAVSVTSAYNYSSAIDRLVVEAVAARVALRSEGDGSLLIQNLSTTNLAIGLWSLADAGKSFIIPEDTTVLANEGVRFARFVTQLEGSALSTLRYPNNAVAASATVGPLSPLRGERVSVVAAPSSVGVSAPLSVPALEKGEGEVLGTGTEKQESNSPVFSWPLAALILVLGAGTVTVYYTQRRVPLAEETSLTAEEFDIEE